LDRDIVFISKATPGDDNFALWLAPKLEAAGYRVFVDAINLRAGSNWRKNLTDTLRDRAVKMLLCCRDSTLSREGVQEEIAIAKHVIKTIGDPCFIIPLRLEEFQPTFGIANTQYVDFKTSWGLGLDELLDELDKAFVPKPQPPGSISPYWETLRRHLSVSIEDTPERLTSNWLRMSECPDYVRFYEVTGALDHGALERAVAASPYPAKRHNRGVLTFLSLDGVNDQFQSVGRFEEKTKCATLDFGRDGFPEVGIEARDARAILIDLLSRGWEGYAESLGLTRYNYSGRSPGFHASDRMVGVGKKVSWGRQGDRRSSMLRNIAKGKVWSYGLSAVPMLWPFPHFRLKMRVLFSDLANGEAGSVIDNSDQQFRLRRSVCKGWRNKQWHGRLMAYLELLSGDSAWISIPLGPTAFLRCDAQPLLFSSPVSTRLPNDLSDEDEESDPALLGGAADLDDDEDEER
jgi:TIR domain